MAPFTPKRSLFLFPLLPLAALPALLGGCTGTVENTPAVQLALLTEGGAALQRVEIPERTAGGTQPPAVPGLSVAVEGGLNLHPQEGGRRLLLTRRQAAEERSENLAVLNTYAEPPFAATDGVCWQASAVSAGAERLAAVSQCGPQAPQNVALYRSSGELVWWAPLPNAFPPADSDAPPLRVAVTGSGDRTAVLIARALLGGGSETMRAAPKNVGDRRAAVSTPQPTGAIRDLAAYTYNGQSTIYAATDSGIFQLNAEGIPEAAPLPAFGTGRYQRLWATRDAVGERPLLLGWRSSAGQTWQGAAGQLLAWNGTSTAENSAATLDTFRNLQDTALADGYLYLLTSDTLRRYDAVAALQCERSRTQSNCWRLENTGLRLNDARAVQRLFIAEK